MDLLNEVVIGNNKNNSCINNCNKYTTYCTMIMVYVCLYIDNLSVPN